MPLFKNKTLQMKLIPDPPDTSRAVKTEEISLAELHFFIKTIGREATMGAAVLIAVYVGTDTIRRVFDNRSKKR